MNAFETFADTAKPQWKRRQEGAVAKRRETLERKKSAVDEHLEEGETLFRLYRSWHRERRADLVARIPEVRGLLAFIRTMTPSSAPALVRLVEDAEWLRGASDADRFLVLHIVGEGIARVRVHDGFPPFDDPLGGDTPSAWLLIRDHIRGMR